MFFLKNTFGFQILKNYSTAIYNAILNKNGELITAISDMKIFSEIIPSYVNQLFSKILNE